MSRDRRHNVPAPAGSHNLSAYTYCCRTPPHPYSRSETRGFYLWRVRSGGRFGGPLRPWCPVRHCSGWNSWDRLSRQDFSSSNWQPPGRQRRNCRRRWSDCHWYQCRRQILVRGYCMGQGAKCIESFSVFHRRKGPRAERCSPRIGRPYCIRRGLCRACNPRGTHNMSRCACTSACGICSVDSRCQLDRGGVSRRSNLGRRLRGRGSRCCCKGGSRGHRHRVGSISNRSGSQSSSMCLCRCWLLGGRGRGLLLGCL